LPNRFGDAARVYPVWRKLLGRTHMANPASQNGFEDTFGTQVIRP
jgi:hypothetical protein